MSARSHVLNVVSDHFRGGNYEYTHLSVTELQALRSRLLADSYFAPFYRAEQPGGGDFTDELRTLERKIVDKGGTLP